MHIRFSVLGPLEAAVDGVAVSFDSPMVKSVCAALLLARGHALTADAFTRSLWSVPPKSSSSNLRSYVSRLRQTFRTADGKLADRLVTDTSGCRLEVREDELDLTEFANLARLGSTHLRAGRNDDAAAVLFDGLSLWRGPAGGDVTSATSGTLARQLADVDEWRLNASEDYLEASVARGDTTSLLLDVRNLTLNHPLRERPWELLMRLLYLSGDPAGALDSYHRARLVFRNDLGIEPGERLRTLERAVLQRDETMLRAGIPRIPALV